MIVIVGCGADGVVVAPLDLAYDQDPCPSKSTSGLECEMGVNHGGKHLCVIAAGRLTMWRDDDAKFFSSPMWPRS